jgi:hypothetical protein
MLRLRIRPKNIQDRSEKRQELLACNEDTMVFFAAKLPDIILPWDRSLIFPQATKWLDLHSLAARLSTALANDFYDLEGQQRRSIERVFRPALKLMRGVGECMG